MTTLRSLVPPLFHGLLLAALIAGCSESSPTRPDDVPASHTVRNGSAWHKPGFRTPLENCVDCHGADLRGGDNGEPSCYSCHGAKWS